MPGVLSITFLFAEPKQSIVLPDQPFKSIEFQIQVIKARENANNT